MFTTTTTTLEYAPSAPLLRRKRARRVMLVVFLLAIAWPIFHLVSPLWQRAKLQYRQHLCLTFTAAPDLLVYDDDPADAATIAAKPNYQLLTNQNFRAPGFPKFAAYMPPCWNDLSAAAFPGRSPLGGAAVIFCHELTSRDGVRRLIVVQRGVNPPFNNYRYLSLDFVIVQPGTFDTKPLDLTPPLPNQWMTGLTPRQMAPLRIYAAQLDPADPSRFTIRYAMGTNEHLLEGRLSNGGNDVTFTYLKPLAKAAQ